MAGGGGGADRATHFGRTGECDLVDVRMFHQRFTGGAIAGHDVDDTGGQSGFLANFGEGQSGERSELGGLQDDRVPRSQRRGNLPRQHEQRKVPWNNLPYDAARLVLGKFWLEQLRPACVMVKMPSDQRNINIAALADWFAVVDGFKNGEPARMFLHQPGHRIEIAGAGVRSKCSATSEAARADRTAASMSAVEPCAMDASFSPVEGSSVSKYSP